MAQYEFLTTWCLDAPIDDVFEVLHASEKFPEWWKGVQSVEVLESGDADGIGELGRYSWRSVLPYTLVFDSRVTRVERPHLIVGEATGELEGVGTWRLFEGSGTAVIYEWRVRTTQVWMNLFGPLARPAFAWNHDRVMRQGGHGIAELLGTQLVAHD
ncbi:MAG: SRPBCC family protein [Thermoleophilaceae bacterium]|nr:SRPBCC family protein [Thermoleophilaceae bacterium]